MTIGDREIRAGVGRACTSTDGCEDKDPKRPMRKGAYRQKSWPGLREVQATRDSQAERDGPDDVRE